MKNSLKVLAGLALLAIVGFVALPSPVAAQDWNWGVTPYIWLPGAQLDITVKDDVELGGRTSFNDLADNVKLAAMLHLEGQKDTFGLLFDVGYFDLGSKNSLGSVAGIGGVSLHTDMKTTIIEGAGVWAPGGKFEGFGLIYGARVWNIQETLDVRAGGTIHGHYTTSPTLLDGMVGFRYLARFGERASFNLRGDYSAGGTDYTMNGVVGFGYAFDDADKYTLLAGYKYMDTRFDENNGSANVKSELTLDGFYAAMRFGF